MSARTKFYSRVMEEFLPRFCDHYGYDASGFNPQTLDRIGEYDALWFLKALETNVVTSERAFFTTLLSGAKEQIFWQYGKPGSMRRITLWAEPIITIAGAARLHCEFGWPKDRIGLQSKNNWAFDLVAYNLTGVDPPQPVVVCEVKKRRCEIDYLVKAMQEGFHRPPASEAPAAPKQRNAYRKVQALRELKPRILWILGPDNYGKLFRVIENFATNTAALKEIEEAELEWRRAWSNDLDAHAKPALFDDAGCLD